MRNYLQFLLSVGFGCVFLSNLYAQESAFVRVKIKDRQNHSIDSVIIQLTRVSNEKDIFPKLLLTDSSGIATTFLTPGTWQINIKKSSYLEQSQRFEISPAQKLLLPIVLAEKEYLLGTTIIRDEKNTTDFGKEPFLQNFPIRPKDINRIPSPKSDIESRLATLPGVVINNEFSSQYRVRGGNFDENLIYVNGVEIYRPQLVRSGQMEGLGFTNANLVKEVNFSAGGFPARYGDKLSSVLEVTYNTPEKFQGSAEIGLLTTQFNLEGVSRNREDSTQPGRFTWLVGARRFNLSSLLNKTDNRGDYRPSFYDIQSVFSYTPKIKTRASKFRTTRKGETYEVPGIIDPWKFTAILTGAYNQFLFFPSSRFTTFGSLQAVLRLYVAQDGREEMSYLTNTNAFIAEHRPSYRLKLRYIVSTFRSIEAERFDVEGAYRLSDVNTNTASEEYGESVFDRSIGGQINHGRNYLTATVYAAEQQTIWFLDRHFKHTLQAGFRYQYQHIDDQLEEYVGLDSAGYFKIIDRIKSAHSVSSHRYQGYAQTQWKLSPRHVLVTGIRMNYWDLNNQLLASPRVQFVYTPHLKDSVSPLQFRLASGWYQQPPFYREMRDFAGNLNTQLKAQRSIHIIGGADYKFTSWGRPFKILVEAYYKKIDNVIPYEIDNVRIRYYATNQAKAYAYGLDTRLNGEFIKGVDSWFSMGLLRTREDLAFDNRGYIQRPSNQWLTLGMFFQDEMPHNPTFKAHIQVIYGTGLPFGPPRVVDQRNVFNAPAYRRFDIGFSKLLTLRSSQERRKKLSVESIWASIEVYNILATNNVVSYTWIKDIYNTQFAVPNYLSNRMLNARVLVRF